MKKILIIYSSGAGSTKRKLALTQKQQERWCKKCLCLVAFSDLQAIHPPLAFDHQSTMDDWLIIEKIEDVVAGTNIPYNYKKSRS